MPAKAFTLQLVMPARPSANVGVLLLDVTNDRLYWRLVSDWRPYADEDDIELLEALDADFREQINRIGGGKYLAQLLDTASNAIRLTDERQVFVSDFQAEVDRLFHVAVESGVG